jgi:hypothetical protein
MAEGRLPKIALKWMPKQRRTRGKPKKNWLEGIKKAMNGRNLKEGQWEDREQWSLGARHHTKFSKPAMMMIIIWRHIKHIVESVHVTVVYVMRLLVCRFN